MESIGLITGTSKSTQVDSGANDTKPAGTTLGTASADFTVIYLRIGQPETNFDRHMTNVLVNDVVVATNIFTRGRAGYSRIVPIFYGGSSGHTIKVASQTDAGTDKHIQYSAMLKTAAEEMLTSSNVTSTYGDANSATTQGTICDPGGSANTEVKTEITTSGGLTEAIDRIVFCLQNGGDSIVASSNWLIRVYTGPTGATDTGLSWHHSLNFGTDVGTPDIIPWNVDRSIFAATTRIWLGVQSSSTTAGDRTLECTALTYQINQVSAGGAANLVDGGLVH